MSTKFLISSSKVNTQLQEIPVEHSFIYTSSSYKSIIKGLDYTIIIDGYILPKIYEDFAYNSNSLEIVTELINKYDKDFILHIKGLFTIVLINTVGFHIYTSRSGIKKVFYKSEGEEFIISNHLDLINEVYHFKLDDYGIINYCLFNNYLNGRTFFKNLFYTLPAAHIWFENILKVERWFDPFSLRTLRKQNYSLSEIAESFNSIIKASIEFFSCKNVCLTLTGGMDSRLILGALYSIGTKPNAISYGNKSSLDSVYARKLAEKLNLPFKNYDLGECHYLYPDYVNKVMQAGSSMINLHRAHRYYAYEQFTKMEWSNGILLTGHMGGELIRNFVYDGLIINSLAEYLMNPGKAHYEKAIINIQEQAPFLKILTSSILKDYFETLIDETSFFSENKFDNEFSATFDFIISSHHSQDMILAAELYDYVYPAYLDDDIVDLLFHTGYNFDGKSNSKLTQITNINRHKFYCSLNSFFFPEISSFPFAKRGSFSADEFLRDNPIKFIFKRIRRYMTDNNKYPNSFNYDRWFYSYLSNECLNMEKQAYLEEYLNIKLLKESLEKNRHLKTEAYWRKYSNVLYISKILNHYKVN